MSRVFLAKKIVSVGSPFSSQIPRSHAKIILSLRSRNFTNSAILAKRREPYLFATAIDTGTLPGMPPTENNVSMDLPVDNAISSNPGLVETSDESCNQPTTRSEDEEPTNSERENEDLYRRKILPEDLSRNVIVLSCESTAVGGLCDVFLVGTAHVSRESCREVRDVISYLKPQVVFLELCSSRIAVLKPQSLKVPTMREMVAMWKKKQNAFGIMYSWFLAKVATKLEVFPGSEFRVAFEEAQKYDGKVVLGDRPVQITLQRTWGKMPLWHKTKLLYCLFFQTLFLPSTEKINTMLKEMDDSDLLTLAIQEMSKEFPTLMETLVHERDQYMASTLQKFASEHSSIVAVVGKGHLHGIKKNWMQPIEMNDLMQMPQAKKTLSAAKIVASIGVAIAGVAIISGIFLSSKK